MINRIRVFIIISLIFIVSSIITPAQEINGQTKVEELMSLAEDQFIDSLYKHKDQFSQNNSHLNFKLLEKAVQISKKIKPTYYAIFGVRSLLANIEQEKNISDLSHLLQLYDQLSDKSMQMEFLNTILNIEINNKFSQLIEDNNPIYFPTFQQPSPLPNNLTELNSEDQQVWQNYKNLTRLYNEFHYDHSRHKVRMQIDNNWDKFNRLLSQHLHGNSPQTLENLYSFYNGEICTRNMGLAHPELKGKAILLTLLQEKRYDLAISLKISILKEYDERFLQILKLAELNWEEIYLGALLDGKYYLAKPLAKYCSLEIANALLRIGRSNKFLNNDYMKTAIFTALASFIAPQNQIMNNLDLKIYQRQTTWVAPPKMEKEILQLITQESKINTSLNLLENCPYLLVK